MSKEDRSHESSKSVKSEGEDSSKGNKKRCCARCRNHESELIELAGHKNFCPWRDCYCELCLRTVCRQQLMADQTASRRKRAEMERRAKNGLPLVVPTANEAKRLKTTQAPSCFLPRDQLSIVSFSASSRSREVSWEAITELMNMFNFNVDTSCLLYLVLKYFSNNVESARSIILSAKEDIKKISSKALAGVTAAPMPQPMYKMNQVEVVPVFVVPSENVLDLSYQSGPGYERTLQQSNPYRDATGAPASAPCVGWKQPLREQLLWPHPYKINPYHEVPSDVKKKRDDKVEEKSTNLEPKTPPLKEESVEKKEQTFQSIHKVSNDSVSKKDSMREEDSLKPTERRVAQNKVSKNRDGYSGTLENSEENRHATSLYRPFQETHQGIGSSQEGGYKDEFSVYGEHVGNQLRSLTDRHSLTVARYEIDQIIFRAIMGEYYVGNCQCCFPDVSKESSFSTRSSPQTPLSSPGFQPYRPVAAPPVQPQPIRPTLVNLNRELM